MTRKKAILTIIISAVSALLGFFTFYKIKYTQNAQANVSQFKDLIDDIADVIIPKTDTPGAKDAKVSRYIINVIENCASPRDKAKFISGLKELDNYSIRSYSSVFSNCSDLNKINILRNFESKGSFSHPLLNKIKRKLLGESFFEQMKWLTVSGYCQSELGAMKGLTYEHIPITYLSCIPYTNNQKSWATK